MIRLAPALVLWYNMSSMWATSRRQGFTIVELLIVIVVIAVLAAITIVAYNGISNRAKASAAQSAASQATKKVMSYAVENSDQYPANLAAVGVADSGSTTYQYSVNNAVNPRTYCVTATTSSVSYYESNTTPNPTSGGCPGHSQNGVSAITNLATNPHAVSGGWGTQTPTGSGVSFQPGAAQDGGSSFQVVTANAGQLRINFPYTATTVAIGDVVSVGGDIFSPITADIQFEVGINGSTYPKTSFVTVTPGWNRVTGSITAPVAGPISIVQFLSSATTPASATQTWRASRVILVKGVHDGSYYDGSSSNWLWSGSVNTSTSYGPPV